MPSIRWPWAIVLCRFNDKPVETRPAEYYRDLYTRNGTGGLADYWRAVSFNALDLADSQVFGWFVMPHASSEVNQLHFPGDRGVLVQWGIDAAIANGVDLAPFRSILVVHNWGVDHGAAGPSVLIVHENPALCEYGFIAHEMGHGLHLPHSNASNPDMVYGDGWDLMSFATTTFQFPIAFHGAAGAATVGINAHNLAVLGAVPEGRLWQPAGPDFSATIVLDPLNQPPIGNRGDVIARLPASATRPARPDGSAYTVEFRLKAGWDRQIPENAVLIHQVRTNGQSYLQPGIWGRFIAGQQFVTPDPPVFIRVVAIDAASASATVRLWDIPEGSVRKEDSNPRVYLIRNGEKCWITSPDVLFSLGKTWDDVRSVPDGALDVLPAGPDLSLTPQLRLRVSPTTIPLGRAVTFTVSASDSITNAAVDGQVLVDGTVIGSTNTPLTRTFRTRRRRVDGHWQFIIPRGVVRAQGYAEKAIDFGFRDA